MNASILLFGWLSLFVSLSAPGAQDATTGSIQGRVVWVGELPPPKPALLMTGADLEGCCETPADMDRRDLTLLVDPARGVANVVFTVTAGGGETKRAQEPVVLDQKGCRFVPHVAVVPRGAKLLVKNSDGTNHNVHTYSRKNQSLNKNVARSGEMDVSFEHEETFVVKCDIHPWMTSHVVVTDATHFAVSSEDGSFRIEGLPPGEYELSWWHEVAGKGKTEKVIVRAGLETELVHGVGAKKEKKSKRRRGSRKSTPKEAESVVVDVPEPEPEPAPDTEAQVEAPVAAAPEWTPAVEAEPAEEESGDGTGGTVRGRFLWEGERPDPEPQLAMKDAELAGCCDDPKEMDRENRSVLIDEEGGIANVVVTLEAEGHARELPKEPLVFDQKGCRFVPHVAVVPLGAKVKFTNSDGTNHNIHTYPVKNGQENKNVAKAGELLYEPEHAETIPVKCDIHPWMSGYLVVTDATHYAVTGPDGSFELTDVPPGEYKLSYWHEKLGKGKTQTVKVTDGKVASVTQPLSEKKKSSGRRRPRR